MSGQQCCYKNESLVKKEPAGGSADSFSPKSDFNRHLLQDLVPYVLCCKNGITSSCGSYYDARPSGSETGYQLPIPGDYIHA